MKRKNIYIFWAVVLFLVGIALLPGISDLRKLPTQTWILLEIGVSLAFVITYFLDGTQKWGWLLPAFVFAGMAIDLSKELFSLYPTQPNGVPIIIGVALWFFVGFLINRKRWWLLIPAYILIVAAVETAVNLMIEPSMLYGENLSTLLLAYSSGAGILLMLALPFFVVYIVSKKSWWALIPAGALTSIALVTILQSISTGAQESLFGIYTGILLLGFSLTFAITWLRQATQPTGWAIYPAAVLFVLALISFIIGNAWNANSDQTKAICFAGVSLVCFIAYFVHGLRKWGWLFPALGCAAIAVTIQMSISGMEDSPLMGLPILLSLALPFYVGYALNRNHWGLLIPAAILTMVAAIVLISDSILEGVGVFFIFAIPFYIIYMVSTKNWWAFIPAGVFTSLGIVVVLEELVPHADYAFRSGILNWGIYTWVLFLGVAVTFAIVWLRHKAQSIQWAGYMALGFLLMAVLAFILGEHFDELWLASLMLVSAGVLLLAGLVNKEPTTHPQTPENNI